MQSIADQRKAVRLLRVQGHTAIDGAFQDLPDAWGAIVLKHAVKGKDGTLRITPAAKARILRDCEKALVEVEPLVALVMGKAAQRAARLPQEALGE